jgi:MYXO-CTERM domain-containing protein
MGEEVTVNGPTGLVAALRLGRVALPILVLALGLGVPGRSAAQGSPPDPDLVQFAGAYTAAWNAHDLPAVLALFAPGAVVRERWGAVPPAVWDTRDPRVARAYLEDSLFGEAYDTHGFAWASGHRQIAAWAAARFAQHHRFAAGPYHAAGETVGWPYREFTDPYQLLPGVGPLEGDAEAVVRDGRITVLSLVVSPASVQQRRGEMATAEAARLRAPGRAGPLLDGPSVPPRGPQPAAAEPADAAWPVALGGLALLAVATVALRRRRLP